METATGKLQCQALFQVCQSGLHHSLGLGLTEIFQTEGSKDFGACKGWGSPSISIGHHILGIKK